ncbi:MAG: FixH family protein [Saprospiraceae bacterium]
MKINWGWGIAVFFSIFVVSLVYFVIKSTTYDNSLVEKDYYAKDIAYQEHYLKLKNSSSLKKNLSITELPQKGAVRLQFPAELGKPSGTIHFFNPAKSELDFTLDIAADTNQSQLIPTAELKKGLWKVKVDWQADGKAFYKEEAVVL